jgi:hypothetical protein
MVKDTCLVDLTGIDRDLQSIGLDVPRMRFRHKNT